MNGMSLSVGQVWLQFCKAVSQISIWLAKKTALTIRYSLMSLVRYICGWKGNCFDKRVKTIKCGWELPDAGEFALLHRTGPCFRYLYFAISTPKFQEIWHLAFAVLIKKSLELDFHPPLSLAIYSLLTPTEKLKFLHPLFKQFL